MYLFLVKYTPVVTFCFLTLSQDLEASQAAAETQEDPSPIELALQSERKERKVAYSGRGGAGNTYDPSELSQTGRYTNDQDDAANSNAARIEGDASARMSGRGGAGNYVSNTEVIDGKEVEPLSGREQVRQPGMMSQVEQDVEKGLPKPDAAYLRPKKEQQKDAPLSGT